MLATLETPDLSEKDAGQLSFALGKAYNDLGVAEKAFPYYQRANQSIDVSFPWEQFEAYLKSQREIYTQAFFDKAPRAAESDFAPVFIVGMLRSGTSLLEQIIAAHSQFCGIGERPELAKVTQRIPDYPHSAPKLTAEQLKQLAGHYETDIAPHRQNDLRPVDKMMTNFMHLGFIALLFPNAKIVHTRRHPCAVALSCFFQNFAHQPGWTTSIDGIGRYYALYEKMMDHWAAHLPLPIHHLSYEALLADPEPETRRLIEFCGADWEPACLEFHKNRSVVQTASNWQVRQPLNRSNAEKWRRYEPYLDDLKPWIEWT
ncbi:MAG: sulfotransferase [Verrucomicrobiota bacterium]